MHGAWEHGIAFGQALERIKHMAERQEHTEKRVDTLETEVSALKSWMRRGGILASLWTGAVGANVAPEKIAGLISGIPKLLHGP